MVHNDITVYPKFNKFDIVTSEALNLMNDNLYNYIHKEYINSCDGIINGFLIDYDKNNIIINEGIIKIDNTILVLKNKINLEIPEKEGRYYLIVFLNKDNNKYILNFKYIEEKQYNCEFIIFSIILRENAKITKINFAFDEYRNEYNTIDITKQKYSSKYSEYNTISPVLLKLWSDKVKLKNLNCIDKSFLLLINSLVVSKQTIVDYINFKLNLDIDLEIDNDSIIKYLAKILTSLEENKNDNENIEKDSFYIS